MEPTDDQGTVSASFFEPTLRLVRDYCRHRRDTPALSDEQFVQGGLAGQAKRVRGQAKKKGRRSQVLIFNVHP